MGILSRRQTNTYFIPLLVTRLHFLLLFLIEILFLFEKMSNVSQHNSLNHNTVKAHSNYNFFIAGK